MTEPKNPKAVVYHHTNKRSVGVTMEKRGLNRIPVRVELAMTSKGFSEPVRAIMIDFSGSGARLECVVDLEVEQLVDLMPGRGEPVFATAKVVRCNPRKREYGIVWVQMNDEMLKGMLTKRKF
jgi:hypothetical protein